MITKEKKDWSVIKPSQLQSLKKCMKVSMENKYLDSRVKGLIHISTYPKLKAQKRAIVWIEFPVKVQVSVTQSRDRNRNQQR